jgi:Integrase core domain
MRLPSWGRLFISRGVPDHIRSDNGGEFAAKAVRNWLAEVGVKPLFIEPGSPWESGYNESFNGKLRDECLNTELFYIPREARIIIECWRRDFNTIRPPSSLGSEPASSADHHKVAGPTHSLAALQLLQQIEVIAIWILQTDHARAPGLILGWTLERHSSLAQSGIERIDVRDRKADVIDARGVPGQPEIAPYRRRVRTPRREQEQMNFLGRNEHAPLIPIRLLEAQLPVEC